MIQASTPSSFPRLHDISRDSLLANLVELPSATYLRAGGHQFASLWTRDFCFSVAGLCHVDRGDVARDHLQKLIDSRREEDALVPRLFDSSSSALRVVRHSLAKKISAAGHLAPKISEPLKPEYLGEHRTPSMDSNLLVLWAALRYTKITQDQEWWEANTPALHEIFEFYRPYFKKGLIHQGPYEDWQDSVKRSGATFYLNLLYYTVARNLFEQRQLEWLSAESIKELQLKIHETFFDSDQELFLSQMKRPQVSLDSNLLALDWNFVTDEETKSRIYHNLKHHYLWNRLPIPGQVTYPDYPTHEVSWMPKVAGLRHYHDRLFWFWLAALAAKVAKKQQDTDEAFHILHYLERLARRDGVIGEVYEAKEDLPLLRRRFYRSETPFSWAAAVTLEALYQP